MSAPQPPQAPTDGTIHLRSSYGVPAPAHRPELATELDESGWTGPALVHQPVSAAGGYIVAYSLTELPRAQGEQDPRGERLDAEYRLLDATTLRAGRPLYLQATRALLAATDDIVSPQVPPAMLAHPRTAGFVTWRRSRGLTTGLTGFVGDEPQVAVLEHMTTVGIDAATPERRLGELIDLVHQAGARVIAEGVRSIGQADAMFALGADLVQGRTLPEGPLERGGLAAGDLSCLELLRLLSDDNLDQNAVIGVVAADPNLSVGVLHLVNSAVFALARRVDSVRQAVVLVGPRLLRALASTALAGAQRNGVDTLWEVLTRGLACWDLAGDDLGYTVGLLSAVAEQRRVDLEWLAQMAGLSHYATAALIELRGPVGAALASVRAYEAGDPRVALRFGLDPHALSRSWLDALPEALTIASALATG